MSFPYEPGNFPSSSSALVCPELSCAHRATNKSVARDQETTSHSHRGSNRVRLGVEGQLDNSTHVIYVSPLKALSNDVQRNLQVPLEGIQSELRSLGLPEINIRTLVRTGDTPAAERTAMTKRPPHIVVTTPESF